METVIRILIGGFVVSLFALIGGLFRPASFSGLFGAAPSVALASLALSVAKNGLPYGALECRSMLIGAAGMAFAAWSVCQLMMRGRFRTIPAAVCSVVAWFIVTLGLSVLLLRS